MATEPDPGLTIEPSKDDKIGATAAFPFDRMTVERFRSAFPRARWRDDLRAWFVPGTTAERRLNRWLGRELSGGLLYADDKGRDAFAFDPIESPYLEAADDVRIRTPYSRTVVEEMRSIPWAWWDGEIKAWRVPYRSLDELRRRWPAIEAAARRNEPAERQKRRGELESSSHHQEAMARMRERQMHRYPVPAGALPPADRVVMTALGGVIFTEITGELVEEAVRDRFYPSVVSGKDTLVWGGWRKPSLEELVKTWPARRPISEAETQRGWWQPTLDELRKERRKARSAERARTTRESARSVT